MNWFSGSSEKAAIERLEGSVNKTVSDLVNKALSDTQTLLGKLRSSFDLAAHIEKLRAEVETLKIEKGRKEEEYARRDREIEHIEHKVGLERARQTQELSLAKREATVGVKEENLAADRKRFEDQMKFHDERFTKEVGYLKEIIGDIAQRLPSATISIKRSEKVE